MDEVYVSEVMTKNITACSPETTIKDVIEILNRNHLSSLVIAENEEPVGIITERDLVAIIEEMLNDEVRENLPIKLFMTSPTHTTQGETTLKEAVSLQSIKKSVIYPLLIETTSSLAY